MDIDSDREQQARACFDLRIGRPVLIRRGLSGSLVLAAERAANARIDIMRTGNVQPYLALSEPRARTLRIPIYDDGVARVALQPDYDSAMLQAIADPSLDLDMPMKGPFFPLRGGDATPALLALDLVRRARLLPVALVAEATDSACEAFPDCLELARTDLSAAPDLELGVSALLPLDGSLEARIHVCCDRVTGEEHLAVEIGSPARDGAPLLRVHSSCYTGDVLGSLRCDCGPQLKSAIEKMESEGGGLLVILQQEGRGIGLSNKIRAYALQDRGFDTFEANLRLGFEEDPRDFGLAAEVVKKLGFPSVRLLSDHPGKREALEAGGIEVVDSVDHAVGVTHHNRTYLAAKRRRRSGQ